MMLLLGFLISVVVIQPSHSGQVSLGSEDQFIDEPVHQSFGQRLASSRTYKRSRLSSTTLFPPQSFPSSSQLSPSSLSPPYITEVQNERLEYEEEDDANQRSLLTGDPITVNKSYGSCTFDGKVYQSGENIERSHLCHFCFCRNGYIDCYWKNCPPAPDGCFELNYDGICERSLYLCPLPKSRKSYPPAVKSLRLKRQLVKRGNFSASQQGCDILGIIYRVGELVGVATDPCLECRCAIEALYCSPKCCFQPAEPDDVTQQLSRAIGHQPVLSNPLLHLRSEFSKEADYVDFV